MLNQEADAGELKAELDEHVPDDAADDAAELETGTISEDTQMALREAMKERCVALVV